ncbi:serine hydrolase domain-containing protein [Vibrio proteolyticus]
MKLYFFLLLTFCSFLSHAHDVFKNEVINYMNYGHIPKLVLVTIDREHNVDVSFLKNESFVDEPHHIDGLFELASLSKSFTGMLAAKLISNGDISPETKLSSILPNIKAMYNDKPVEIELRHLLNHTSGIPFKSIDFLYSKPNEPLDRLVDSLGKIDLDSIPGKQFTYATINYDIVARVLEKVSGVTYQKLLQDELLSPLSMTDTSVSSVAIGREQGYQISYLKARPYDAPFVESNVPAGYIQTSAADMKKWLKFLTNLSRETSLINARSIVYSAIYGVNTGDDEDTMYTFGWFKKGRQLFHTGMNPSFSSYIALDTVSGAAVAVLANVNSNITFEIGKQVMKNINSGTPVLSVNKAQNIVLFDTYDRIFVVGSLVILPFLILSFYANIKWVGKMGVGRVGYLASLLFTVVLVLVTVFVLVTPTFATGLSWQTITIWLPGSFWCFYSILISVLSLSIGYLFRNTYFIQKNNYK